MKRIDFDYIKNTLSEDNIVEILDRLGAQAYLNNNQHIEFTSICHNSNSHKLYYYKNSKNFFCHRCGKSWDIFSLVQQVLNYDNVIQAVEYVCNVCKIDISTCQVKPNIDQWQSMKKFLPNYEQSKQKLVVYDKSVLDLFKPSAHISWLNDGISKQAMAKFNIGWYARNEQITLPVFDINGDLVGIHARNTKKWLVDKGLKYQPVKTLNEEYKFPTGQVLYGLYQNQADIEQTKEVTIFEAPKSVLQADSILEQNNTVALFGWNMQPIRRDILIKYNIQSVNIALDKQYQSTDDAEFQIYRAHVNKIVRLFKPYCDVYVIWDSENILDYKDSPTDKDKDVWDKLYNNRILVK